MTHGAGGDPHWFDYPTLLMYVLAPFQAWQAAPSYLTARIVVALLGVAAVGAAWWLGRRAYAGSLPAAVAAAVTAVCTIHVFYSHAAVTDVPLTLGVASSLALAASGRLELAGVAAGIAAGFKYPGVLLAVPLVVAGWGRWRRVALSLALLVAAFLATSPFFVVHLGEAVGDALRVQRRARRGWLGFEHDHAAPIAFVDRLWEGIGPVLLVAAAGIVVALVRRRRADLVLVSFVLVYFADLATLDAHFDRYVLPLVPALGALAGRLRPLAPVTLLLLVVPLTWSIRDDARLTRTDTRVVAARWFEAHVPRGAAVAADPSTPHLDGYRVLPLALPAPWQGPDPNRDVARLRARGIEWLLVTGAVADRVRRAGGRYPRELAFYDSLRRERRAYYASPGHGLSGPWVAVYHL
jgi:glycosyl transferase family 87